MALSFAHFDEAGGGDQMEYYGCARLAVLKRDGIWAEIKGPESLFLVLEQLPILVLSEKPIAGAASSQ
jgi:hypothetical protein